MDSKSASTPSKRRFPASHFENAVEIMKRLGLPIVATIIKPDGTVTIRHSNGDGQTTNLEVEEWFKGGDDARSS